jgi:hypothetical protein
VLRAFIAVAGMRGPGLDLKGVLDALSHPFSQFGTLLRFGRNRLANIWTPEVPVEHASLQAEAHELGRRVRDFGKAVEAVLRSYREAVLEKQYIQERLAETAIELYTSATVISRLDSMLTKLPPSSDRERDLVVGRFYLKAANRRMKQHLAALWDNDDEDTTAAANHVLGPLPEQGNGKPA